MCSGLKRTSGIKMSSMSEYQLKAVLYIILSFALEVNSAPSSGAKSLGKNLMDKELGPFDKRAFFRPYNHQNRNFHQIKMSL